MTIFKNMIATSAVLTLLASPAFGQSLPTSVLDISSMPGNPIWDGLATATPLAFDEQNNPTVIVLHIPAGTIAEHAHATSDGRIRFATVLSGTMFYADGDSVEEAKETPYSAGSMLLISSGTKHWVSAREGEVVLMLTAVSPENLSAPVMAQHAPNQ